MRLLVRLAIFGILVVTFLIFTAYKTASRTYTDDETDEAIKLLLATGDNPQAMAGLVQTSNKAGIHPANELTFNVAVVMVVSLLSVALLITGIIVVAVTLDPGESKYRQIEETNDNLNIDWEGMDNEEDTREWNNQSMTWESREEPLLNLWNPV
ncbi:unnamed protein product [Bursaphelenchus xylophilus]|uniref:(pine wood nematode) hypothetical protein n=1 Tax=Bursaphelenchus xylophilus TaxID=6326 RepID=A0A1I7RPI6_BURXY|nr:unnamed protein product [Bursaphelenchus xylophilus]CAG9096084.1 unnamed protein product [Bursaphelenchus xylophilus]